MQISSPALIFDTALISLISFLSSNVASALAEQE